MAGCSCRPASVLAAIAAVALAGAARADDQVPIVHPLYVHLPDAPEEDVLRRAFTAAAARYKLRPVEVVDIPAPPAPRAPDLLKTGIINTQKIAFGEALRDLDAAAAEAAATGGAGLSTDELADLYLNRAIATAHADWNATAAAPPTEARTRAYADYLRAATLAPARTLNTREIPPQAVADFARAVAEVRQRPRGTLTVAGSADAQVALDGGAPMPVAGGVVFRDLVHGEHLIRVEEIGHVGWGAVVAFNQPTQDVAIPARALLGLDGATAAAHARRMGALLRAGAGAEGGPARPGRPAPDRCVRTGARRGAGDAGERGRDDRLRRHAAGRDGAPARADRRAIREARRRPPAAAPSSRRRCWSAQPPAEGRRSATIRPRGRAITGRC